MTKRPRVTVLGSLNMDISVTVPRLPGPGATVLGSAARFSPGGKGANQAVAAARLGADVAMVGCVGDDDFGRQLLAALRAEAVDTDAVRTVPGVPTGLAMIAVDQPARTSSSSPPAPTTRSARPKSPPPRAANPRRRPGHQRRDPRPRDRAALARPARTCMLNLAPAPPTRPRPGRAGGHLDWLVVNESEAAAVLGRPVSGLAAAEQAAADLVALGPRHAVVTAGAHGAALAGPDGTNIIAGFKVQAVDTVGAGDTFVGALAVALAAGVPAAEAVRAAAAAGAAAVTRQGAQAAMPRPADILAATGLTWPVA